MENGGVFEAGIALHGEHLSLGNCHILCEEPEHLQILTAGGKHNMKARPLDDDRSGTPTGREPVFNIAGVVLFLIAVCVLVHVGRMYVLSPQQDVVLLIHAAFFPVRYSGNIPFDLFALSTPVTYSFLHGSGAHLAINMIWLAAFGSPLAVRIGAPRMLVFWLATAVAAAFVHYVLFPQSAAPLVGASGAISGMMGAAARFGFRTDRSSRKRAFSGPLLTFGQVFASRTVIAFLAVWMVINLVSGLGVLSPAGSGTIAWEAHIGGFVVGFFGISLFKGKM